MLILKSGCAVKPVQRTPLQLTIYSFIQLINYTTKTKDEKRLPRGYRDGD
jgi:hypothetical protein